MVQTLLIGSFGTAAMVTGHPHWQKEAPQLEPIVGPLCRMIQQVPAKTLKAVESKANGLFLVIGCFAVLGPDVAAEIRLRKLEADEKRNTQRQVGRGYQQPPRPYQGDQGGQSPNGAGNDASDPTLPPPGLETSY